MRLKKIEALRYGSLENASLDGLGEGLTVVLGPNESGKTTFTNLTRHVLYGYPDARRTEAGYASPRGPRAGRLVFADETGEWAVERIDGRNRGTVSVTAVRGADRPGLLGELTGGVSEQSFRVVFGFGLDELAQIEGGSGEDILGRLHAAGTGLGVNPMDVRRDLEKAAAEQYAPHAQKPVANAAASKMRELKARIRVLEDQAADYTTEQQRLRQLEDEIAPLKERRDALGAQLASLARDAQRCEAASERLTEIERELSSLAFDIAELEKEIGFIHVDERVLAREPEITAALEGAPLFQERLDRMAAAQKAADDLRCSVRAMTELPQGAVDSVANRTAVNSYRDRLASVRADADAAERAAQRAEAQAAGSEVVLAQALAEGSAPSNRRGSFVAIAAVAALAGALLAGVALLAGQPIVAMLGGAVGLVGVIALIALLLRRAAPDQHSTLASETERLKAEAAAQREYAQRTARTLADTEAEWRSWLAEQQLDAFGTEVPAVCELLERLHDRQRALAEADRYAAEIERDRAEAEQWVARLVEIVAGFDEGAGQLPGLSGAAELIVRVRSTLATAQAAAKERAELNRQLDALSANRRKLEADGEGVRSTLGEVTARYGLGDDDPAPVLSARIRATEEEFAQVRADVERLSDEASRLRGKLDEEGRDSEMATLRQQLESERVTALDAADAYLVNRLAVGLLDRARERFERDRQPEVVRTAARVFSAMTDSRYIDVRVPLDRAEIVVLDQNGAQHPSRNLSRGTAEQLYLALRVGLIGTLGELGRSLPVLMDDVVVNFDPERRRGAVAAVSELAAMRQVVFFTCHPETAELLADSVADVSVVNLSRCSLMR
ncbi:MAG: AAA family ATPase [Coriobacteriia bacterium]